MDRIDPRQYDQHAAEFEELAEAASYNALYERPATLELIGDVTAKRVLDVACGPGWHAKQLIDQGGDVVGCDASPAMVAVAAAATGQADTFRVHECDAPFEWVADESIDIVLMALAYHYVNDHDRFLGDMYRVLRPGGVFVISTHHPLDDFRRLGNSYFDHERVTERWGRWLGDQHLAYAAHGADRSIPPGRFLDRAAHRTASASGNARR